MKFGLQFREQYQKEAGGSIASEMDNLVAFLQMLWDKVLDSEGNIKISITDNSHGGAGTKPVYTTLVEQIESMNTDIANAGGTITADGIYLVQQSLTNLQQAKLNSNPVVLAASPGANKVALPLALFHEVSVASTYGSTPGKVLTWDTAATVTALTISAASLTSTGIRSRRDVGTGVSFGPYATFDLRNKPIYLFATGDLATSNGSATMKTTLMYAVCDSH